MSNIDKRALREAAENAIGAHERLSVMPPDDIFDISLAEGTQLDADITALNALNSAANPATVLSLLDDLEAMHKYAKERDAENEGLMFTVGRLRCEKEAAEKRIADYQELISGLVGVSSSILREVERINVSAASKGDAS